MYAHCVPASGGHDFKSGCFRIWTPYSLFLAKSLPIKEYDVVPICLTTLLCTSIVNNNAMYMILLRHRKHHLYVYNHLEKSVPTLQTVGLWPPTNALKWSTALSQFP